MGVAHPRCEISSLSASPFGTLVKCVGGGRGKSKMSRIWKLDIACKHLGVDGGQSSTSTGVREVVQGVTKRSRVSNQAANRLPSYLHRSIANPATQNPHKQVLPILSFHGLVLIYQATYRQEE